MLSQQNMMMIMICMFGKIATAPYESVPGHPRHSNGNVVEHDDNSTIECILGHLRHSNGSVGECDGNSKSYVIYIKD